MLEFKILEILQLVNHTLTIFIFVLYVLWHGQAVHCKACFPTIWFQVQPHCTTPSANVFCDTWASKDTRVNFVDRHWNWLHGRGGRVYPCLHIMWWLQMSAAIMQVMLVSGLQRKPMSGMGKCFTSKQVMIGNEKDIWPRKNLP